MTERDAERTPEVRRITAGTSTQGLVEALDELLAVGVAVTGDVIIQVAGIDLIRLDLRALLASVGTVDGSVPR